VAAERDEKERAAWRVEHADLDPAQIVSVDESGSNAALAQRYAWSPKGERAEHKLPRNRGANTTLLAALTPKGLLEPMLVAGGTTIEVFLSYLERFLCPVLRPGQVVLMDNLRVHKNRAVVEKIEATGARVVFLPRYSPDFAPIEGVFSKLKAYLRRKAPRTSAALDRAISRGLATITARNARGWFAHCGFPIKAQTS
jgi:transposase